MSENEPPPLSPEPKPLEYWHSNDPAPVHPVLLALCLLVGFGIGMAVVLGCGGSLFLGMFDAPHPDRSVEKMVAGIGAAVWLALVAACIYGLERKIRSGRTLTIENRRKAGRFFTLGLLIGCGLACLLEGICFGFGAASS